MALNPNPNPDPDPDPDPNPNPNPNPSQVLGDLSYEDLSEVGIKEVGPRRKVYRAITH